MAALAMIVIERVVPDASVIPERQRSRAPAESASVGFAPRHLEQVAKQRRAFLLGPSGKAQCESRVDVESLAAGFGMRAHNRMFVFRNIIAHDLRIHRSALARGMSARAVLF